jgi:hypothetical protein
MGVWAPLRGPLGLGCDETILGVSSMEDWGISALRCSIMKACGLFNYDDDEYLKALEETPIIPDSSSAFPTESDRDGEAQDESREAKEDRNRVRGRRPLDDYHMRGKVFGREKTLRKKIYRW